MKAGTPRAKISFAGWDECYDEWVSLDYVRPGGIMIATIWLTVGNFVCLGEKDIHNPGLEDMLLAKVLEIRPDTATVFNVKVQVYPDMDLPHELSGEPREATEEELDGMWVEMTSGSIHPSNVGGTG